MITNDGMKKQEQEYDLLRDYINFKWFGNEKWYFCFEMNFQWIGIESEEDLYDFMDFMRTDNKSKEKLEYRLQMNISWTLLDNCKV